MMYAFIFVAKLLEVSISTIRVVLTSRGSKYAPSLLAAVEITIWLIVTSTVLLGITEDPLRAVAYGVAFVAGVYLGVILEDKLALGLSQIEIIAEFDLARQITGELREKGYGATTFICEGMDGQKLSIELKVQRKDVTPTLNMLKKHKDLFVTISDIRSVGFGSIARRKVKKSIEAKKGSKSKKK